MTSIIGYNIHSTLTYGRGYSADEQTKFWQHLERLQPESLLFMDNLDWARQAKKLLPSCIVVHRRWRANDGALHLNTSPQWFYDTYAHDAEGGIVVQCLNEPSGYDKLTQLASWCASVMEKFAAAGLALALPNFGVGHPDLNKLLDLTVLWEAFKKYPQHYFASHEYATYRGMTYTDATHKRDVVPWRVGRFKIIVDYVKTRFDYDLSVLVTEFGIDSSFYPDDIKEKRGWRDAGITEIEYANQLIKAANEVYNVPNVKGLHIFSFGNTGKKGTESDWQSHDVSFLGDFQRTLEDYSARRIEQSTPPLPPPMLTLFPADIDPRWEPVTLTSMGTYAHIRKQPSTSAESLRTFVLENVSFIPYELLRDDEQFNDLLPKTGFGFWVPVKMGDIRGWIRSDAVIQSVLKSYKAPDEPPTIPGPAPENPSEEIPPIGPTDAEIRTLLRELVAAINRQSDSLERLAIALEHQTEVEERFIPQSAN